MTFGKKFTDNSNDVQGNVKTCSKEQRHPLNLIHSVKSQRQLRRHSELGIRCTVQFSRASVISSWKEPHNFTILCKSICSCIIGLKRVLIEVMNGSEKVVHSSFSRNQSKAYLQVIKLWIWCFNVMKTVRQGWMICVWIWCPSEPHHLVPKLHSCGGRESRKKKCPNALIKCYEW